MTMEVISVEEFLRTNPVGDEIQELIAVSEIGLNTTSDDSFTNNLNLRDLITFIGLPDGGFDKSEFDQYLPASTESNDDGNNYINQQLIDDTNSYWTGQLAVQSEQVASQSTGVPLSNSVKTKTVTQSKTSSCEIQVVNKLEPTYKPRYKSDYFSSNGNVHPPRYVSDEYENHFVTLKVAPSAKILLRIDWVTIEKFGNIRFSMPGKFQENNKSNAVEDRNPIVKEIEADDLGFIRLQVVLIKPKQSEVISAQPLQPFPPVEQSSNFLQIPKMPPKQLIEYYDLDKSQLAFTLCSLGPDRKSYRPAWNTTVYSTVMTEEPSNASKKRSVTCPKCSHSFEPKQDSTDDIGHEKVVKKRKK
ncbi:hypothetical protein I4U23_007135 [Adineta vaga]|nr:hypothetical protein I4U23_007135 [Adineta vaga]